MSNETKNCIEVIYWVLSFIVLTITAYYVSKAPIEAVKLGRKLNDEQNKDSAKRNLFLTLYSYKGSPAHQYFADALNRIDVLFHENPKVIEAWHTLHNSMELPEGAKETLSDRKKWGLLRVSLLDEMASVLGYTPNLKQVDMMKHYSPQAEEFREVSEWEFRDAALNFYRAGFVVYEQMIQNMKQGNDDSETDDEKKTQ